MPSRSLTKCTYPGCMKLVRGGRCPAHSGTVRDPAVKKLYNSARWKYMRAVQLGKEPWCADCLEGGDHVFASEVDHVRPHNGDPKLFFDDGNLQSLCKPHHSAKTAQEVWHA